MLVPTDLERHVAQARKEYYTKINLKWIKALNIKGKTFRIKQIIGHVIKVKVTSD